MHQFEVPVKTLVLGYGRALVRRKQKSQLLVSLSGAYPLIFCDLRCIKMPTGASALDSTHPCHVPERDHEVLGLESLGRPSAFPENRRNHLTLRVQVPNNYVLGIWVIVIIAQTLGKHMIIGYLDAQGKINVWLLLGGLQVALGTVRQR